MLSYKMDFSFCARCQIRSYIVFSAYTVSKMYIEVLIYVLSHQNNMYKGLLRYIYS